MKKVLMVTSVASMISQFNIHNLKILKDLGYEVTVATNFNSPGNIPIKNANQLVSNLEQHGVKTLNLNMNRSPLSVNNIKVMKQLSSNINKNDYDLIHCQSPVGGVVTRLAARKSRKKGTKLIYTAHGFHFYDGAPIKNWIIFYPIEKLLSRWTDILITINQEDYNRAKKKFLINKIMKIPGVGINVKKIAHNKTDFKEKRQELDIPGECYLLLSVGELNENKNHRIIIDALAKINNPYIHYAVAGIGNFEEKLKQKVDEYGLTRNVHFLGYRNDIYDIYQIADAFAFPSKREGLGLAAIEAMASGLPLITSNIHGIVDYSKNEETGFTFSPNNIDQVVDAIENVYNLTKQQIEEISLNNKKEAKKYDQSIIDKQMRSIYESVIVDREESLDRCLYNGKS